MLYWYFDISLVSSPIFVCVCDDDCKRLCYVRIDIDIVDAR